MATNNYYKEAANWWSSQIKNSSGKGSVPNLDEFEKQLSVFIKDKVSFYGSMCISTSEKRSKLLDQIALNTEMFSPIPSGYDMNICFDNIFIYSNGQLAKCF